MTVCKRFRCHVPTWHSVWNNSRSKRFQKTNLYDWNLLIPTMISVYKLIQAHVPNAQYMHIWVRHTVDGQIVAILNTMSWNTSYFPSEITRWSITIDRYFSLFNKSIIIILDWTTNAQSNATPLLVWKIFLKRNHKQQFKISSVRR